MGDEINGTLVAFHFKAQARYVCQMLDMKQFLIIKIILLR